MVFIFRHEEQRSFEEIAGIMGLDAGTAKAHMARAIKKLREELREPLCTIGTGLMRNLLPGFTMYGRRMITSPIVFRALNG